MRRVFPVVNIYLGVDTDGAACQQTSIGWISKSDSLVLAVASLGCVVHPSCTSPKRAPNAWKISPKSHSASGSLGDVSCMYPIEANEKTHTHTHTRHPIKEAPPFLSPLLTLVVTVFSRKEGMLHSFSFTAWPSRIQQQKWILQFLSPASLRLGICMACVHSPNWVCWVLLALCGRYQVQTPWCTPETHKLSLVLK